MVDPALRGSNFHSRCTARRCWSGASFGDLGGVGHAKHKLGRLGLTQGEMRLFARGYDGSHEGDSRPAEAAIGRLTHASSDTRRLERSKGRGILE